MEQESTATLYITYSIGVCISSINCLTLDLVDYYKYQLK